MKSFIPAISVILSLLFLNPLLSHDAYQDFFRSTGKINTVLAVVVILFVVLILFLIRLEKKINKLEKNIKDEEQTG